MTKKDHAPKLLSNDILRLAGQNMSPSSRKHGLQQVITELSHHLSGHDQKIAFLLGAGASCAVEVPSDGEEKNKEPFIPDIERLTEACETSLCGAHKSTWDEVKSLCQNEGVSPNVEDILTKLYFIQKLAEGTKIERILNGITISDIKSLDTKTRNEVVSIIKKNEKKIIAEIPHCFFARWLGSVKRAHPTEVFTVNYDILIEWALEYEQIPFFDGFVGSHKPFFHSDSLQEISSSNISWTRLWKMHGSVNWEQEKYGEIERIVRVTQVGSGQNENSKMIFPSYQKSEESKQQPYEILMERLRSFLSVDGGILIVIGFSFRDRHINSIIFNTVKNRPKVNLYAMQFKDEEDSTDLVKVSKIQKNITVVCPNFGIIRGEKLQWESNEEINYGNFNNFCQLLQKISPQKEENLRVV